MKLNLAATLVGAALFGGVLIAAPDASAASFPEPGLEAARLFEQAQLRRRDRDDEGEDEEDFGPPGRDDEDEDEEDARDRRRGDDYGRYGRRRPPRCDWILRRVWTGYGYDWRRVRVCRPWPPRRSC